VPRDPRTLASVLLGAALVAVLAGALTVLGGAREVPAPVPAAAPAPLPTTTTTPAVAVSATPTPTPTTARPTTTTSRRTTTTTRRTPSAAECERIAVRSDLANAELRPYLRSIGCDDAADGLLVGAAAEEDDPGELALRACTEQTGMTRAECLADIAAGNAN
jgi:hypothetical protein